MAKTIEFLGGREKGTWSAEPTAAARAIVGGHTRRLDVTELSQEGVAATYYSVVTVSWGLGSDVDIESEVCRCCGSFRFTLWAIWRICCLRPYAGRISYKPVGTEDWVTIDDDFTMVFAANVPWIAPDMYMAPKAPMHQLLPYMDNVPKIEQGTWDTVYMAPKAPPRCHQTGPRGDLAECCCGVGVDR